MKFQEVIFKDKTLYLSINIEPIAAFFKMMGMGDDARLLTSESCFVNGTWDDQYIVVNHVIYTGNEVAGCLHDCKPTGIVKELNPTAEAIDRIINGISDVSRAIPINERIH